MRIEQACWSVGGGWVPQPPGALAAGAQVVLAFGSRSALQQSSVLDDLRRCYRSAYITGCSTAGEIFGTRVLDDSIVVTAIQFDKTTVRVAMADLADTPDSAQAGRLLAERLGAGGLRHVLVLSDGLHVNGSELVQGLTKHLPPHVTVTGGLSADGSAFKETAVVADGLARDRVVVAIGLGGDDLQIGYGSVGGWDPFGPERLITRATGNVLYELDGQSALALYKRYLGDQASGLPASGLLFPLCIRSDRTERGVVRTILSVSDADDSMTFAGDIAEGSYAQLMRANFDRLIEGAAGAARISHQAIERAPQLALLISCVGRKMVLKQRVEEEVESVSDIVGPDATLAGFYSYGEISPFTPSARCELHNQTMTITTLAES
jgi:hypothetical protein